ncbi:hypothetical protein U1Q18_005988 [Sarracenia purpurea var. burkii]
MEEIMEKNKSEFGIPLEKLTEESPNFRKGQSSQYGLEDFGNTVTSLNNMGEGQGSPEAHEEVGGKPIAQNPQFNPKSFGVTNGCWALLRDYFGAVLQRLRRSSFQQLVPNSEWVGFAFVSSFLSLGYLVCPSVFRLEGGFGLDLGVWAELSDMDGWPGVFLPTAVELLGGPLIRISPVFS